MRATSTPKPQCQLPKKTLLQPRSTSQFLTEWLARAIQPEPWTHTINHPCPCHASRDKEWSITRQFHLAVLNTLSLGMVEVVPRMPPSHRIAVSQDLVRHYGYDIFQNWQHLEYRDFVDATWLFLLQQRDAGDPEVEAYRAPWKLIRPFSWSIPLARLFGLETSSLATKPALGFLSWFPWCLAQGIGCLRLACCMLDVACKSAWHKCRWVD